MSFFIKPHKSSGEWVSYADHKDIRAYLQDLSGKQFGSKLPMDFSGAYGPVPTNCGRTTTLIVHPGNKSATGDWRGKSSSHRVYASCPDCEVAVPAGRTHQHKCKEGK